MNLENLNLVELNAQEVQETEGGSLFGLIVFIAFIATAYFVKKNNPNDTNIDWTPGPYYPSGNSGETTIEILG